MKKIIVLLLISSISFTSFGNNSKGNVKPPTDGKQLFASKTCSACHNETAKVVGPSIKEITTVYAKKGANIFDFLRGNSKAIVDTNPGQVAIMKSNVDTMVKDISDADLKAIITYMKSIK